MAFVLLIAGLIHLPNLMFYRSNEYSPLEKAGISLSLQGSAVCTNYEFVVCSDCLDKKWYNQPEGGQRIGYSYNAATGANTTLIERFDCKGGYLAQGIVNWVCLLFLVFSMVLIHLYLGAREVRFDEDKYVEEENWNGKCTHTLFVF
jgi:hypothetical protein